MLIYEKGDLLASDCQFICHQVNCQGVMGSGIAKQIRDKYSFVYDDYKRALDYENAKLGHIVISYETGVNGREIISMFAQEFYGRKGKYTDYDAFKTCLEHVARHVNKYSYDAHPDWKVGFPKYIGCGLAGGDWNIVEPMLKEFSEKIKFDTVIISLE